MGESNLLKVVESNGNMGVSLYIPVNTSTGTEWAWAQSVIIWAPVGATSPPLIMTAWVPITTLFTLDIIANTAESATRVTWTPPLANRFARICPLKEGALSATITSNDRCLAASNKNFYTDSWRPYVRTI